MAALGVHAQLIQKSSIQAPAPVQDSSAAPVQAASQAVPDTIVDTVYVVVNDGVPWNREHFDPDRLLRHESFDPALTVGYTYSVSFISGPLGSLSQTSYLAHLTYEFFPELHLYADLGLWMPLYSTLHYPNGFSREDVRQGRIQPIIPGMELEYKPTENTSFRFRIENESDAIKAYGPWRAGYYPYYSRRYSRFGY